MGKLITIYLEDVIEDVVTAMISNGTIISAIETAPGSEIWLITVSDTGNLVDNFKVLIESKYYRVSSVTDTTFKISSSTSLTGLATKAWTMYFNYQYGSRVVVTEIQNQLSSNEIDNRKFDLIWLVTDITRKKPNENNNIYREIEFIMSFVTDSEISFNQLDGVQLTPTVRLEKRFKSRLMPIIDLFFEKLELSDAILLNPNERIGGEEIMRYFYGSQDGNENILNEPTDAVELKLSLKLDKQFINNC